MFSRTLLLFATIAAVAVGSFAQTPDFTAPRETKLLNGTRVLFWADPAAPKVAVKIRIHSGAAFDPAGKEGLMQLVADNLFPGDTTREFFTDDLGGTFEVVSNYDYIQINTTADPDKLLTVLETLAAAVTNPQINKESTTRLKAQLTERVKKLEADPLYVAERAAAKRLFGNYPYGRPALGTAESIAKIDFADLLDADHRFFTADNATIAVTGNVTAEFVQRASKRLFGGWLKADKRVPATFAQPNAPDAASTVISGPAVTNTLTLNSRSIAGRGDKDYWANVALALVLQRHFCGSPNAMGIFDYSGFVLKGTLSMRSYSAANTENDKSLPCTVASFSNIKPVDEFATQANFDWVKTSMLDSFGKKYGGKQGLADFWLDIETYKLPAPRDEYARLSGLTLADVQRVGRTALQSPSATVVLPASQNAATN